jgi:hypothetical protein
MDESHQFGLNPKLPPKTLVKTTAEGHSHIDTYIAETQAKEEKLKRKKNSNSTQNQEHYE